MPPQKCDIDELLRVLGSAASGSPDRFKFNALRPLLTSRQSNPCQQKMYIRLVILTRVHCRLFCLAGTCNKVSTSCVVHEQNDVPEACSCRACAFASSSAWRRRARSFLPRALSTAASLGLVLSSMASQITAGEGDTGEGEMMEEDGKKH